MTHYNMNGCFRRIFWRRPFTVYWLLHIWSIILSCRYRFRTRGLPRHPILQQPNSLEGIHTTKIASPLTIFSSRRKQILAAIPSAHHHSASIYRCVVSCCTANACHHINDCRFEARTKHPGVPPAKKNFSQKQARRHDAANNGRQRRPISNSMRIFTKALDAYTIVPSSYVLAGAVH